MAYTQADIDALKRAMAQGAQRVKFADREVTYRDHADMVAQLRLMQDEIAAETGVRHVRVRQHRFVTSKGLR